MYKIAKIIIVLLLIVSCTPYPVIETPPPDATPTRETPGYLNPNPDLALGECNVIMFHSEKWGDEFLTQCVPANTTLYERVVNYPIRMQHTGAAYSVLPNGGYGAIGFNFAPMQLSPSCVGIYVFGHAEIEGALPYEVNIRARFSIDGVDGMVYMGAHDLDAKGPYTASFYLNAQQLGTYNVTVYLSLQYPSATASSYMTFERITMLEVSAGHCN